MPSNETRPQSSQLRYVHVPSNINRARIDYKINYEIDFEIDYEIDCKIDYEIDYKIDWKIACRVEKSPIMLAAEKE